MSLKHVLGAMLASRMAGRGRGGGALGTAALMGLGGRRGGMGGKLGMAAMGYMAYRAFQNRQPGSGGMAGHSAGMAGGGSGGGLGDMIRDVADRFTGGGASSPQGGAQQGGAQRAAGGDLQEQERAAAAFSDEKALLLIRAMVTAAYSDGSLSQDERGRIMGEIEQSGGDSSDRQTMEREIANPRPLDELLRQVTDHETAQEFYLASRAAIDADTPQNSSYLADLRQRLNLSQDEAQEVEEMIA
jgi:uncharacterized membrane protein YebE (DUF533 family)